MESTSELINVAHQCHQQGELNRAEAIYREVLAVESGRADVWHDLGDVCRRQGRFAAAAEAFTEAVHQAPEQIEWSLALGDSLAAMNRLQDAAVTLRRALSRSPDSVEAHHNLGNVLRQRGQFDEALVHFRRALQLRSDQAEIWINAGITLAASGRLDEAVEHLRQAVQLQPAMPQAHHNLGVALLEQGRHEEAIASLQEALQHRPDYPEAHFNLGSALVNAGNREGGIEHFYETLRLKPDHAGALNNLGLALKDTGDPEQAVVVLKQAARTSPGRPDVHNNLGLALADLGRLEEAIACYERALEYDPRFADAHANLGSAYKEQGRLNEALAGYEMALRLDPESNSTRWNRALALLASGDYERGWAEYEWRFKRGPDRLRPFAQPLWDGSPLHGRPILLHMEQGLGDMLQFIRYAMLVKEAGGTVIVECPQALIALFSTCPGIDRLVAEGDELPPFDVHAPLMSLPRIFRTTLETVPSSVPYLFADWGRCEHWRGELDGEEAFKVGLCWQGNARHPWDRHRSAPLETFAPLVHIEGVRTFSLQKGLGREQITRSRLPITELAEDLDAIEGTFVDTAAIIANLDLVVTVDTAMAHLAGALGATVWLALSDITDWRWMRDRGDSPWYPTMRLFRQQRLGDWGSVVRRMTEELRTHFDETRTSGTVRVEISPGELIDKISILQIKSERITNPEKLNHVHRELAMLIAERDRAVTSSDELPELAAELKSVNERLWDIEDALRRLEHEGRFGEEFIELARSVYRYNDQRAALKRRINDQLGARFCEQKQHPGSI